MLVRPTLALNARIHDVATAVVVQFGHQGLTLRPLLMRLGLEDDGSVEREVRHARVEALRAGLQAAEGWPRADAATLVRQSYELQLRRAEEELAGAGREGTPEATIGDTAFQRLEGELDWLELGWAQVLPPEPPGCRQS